ncbi:MAG: EamA family transporter [Defluviitaleaceae bacterium]|nr:EamA family transporter [Defluviitaleaceae bacterium]
MWFLYAVGAAVFAALTTILAKIGIKNVDSHLATAIRTVVVLVFAWLMVFVVGSQGDIFYIQGRTWVFLILSGLATGGSWLCFFRALQLGNVNKVVPIDKSSTILTMILAFIFLSEPLGWITAAGMLLMGAGTWMMLELKKDNNNAAGKGWLLFALLAAVFASLVAVFGRVGVAGMDANLWTAIRTMVVVPLSWLMVFITGRQNKEAQKTIDRKSWVFLILSGVATGASWLFFYHALQLGNASHVVPIDKLSIVLTMGFARLFLGERFTKRSIAGLGLLTIGTLVPIFI